MGFSKPLRSMLWARAASSSSWKSRRVWWGLGVISPMGSCCTAACFSRFKRAIFLASSIPHYSGRTGPVQQKRSPETAGLLLLFPWSDKCSARIPANSSALPRSKGKTVGRFFRDPCIPGAKEIKAGKGILGRVGGHLAAGRSLVQGLVSAPTRRGPTFL